MAAYMPGLAAIWFQRFFIEKSSCSTPKRYSAVLPKPLIEIGLPATVAIGVSTAGFAASSAILVSMPWIDARMDCMVAFSWHVPLSPSLPFLSSSSSSSFWPLHFFFDWSRAA